MPPVTLKHLTKTFRSGPTVVDDFSLDVADGELVVLFGPSGCGKTTTLRMVAGLEPLTAGCIFIDNQCVESADKNSPVNIAPARRNVAMVFQNQALYPHLDVFANMAFGLRMRGTPQPDIRRRVTEVAQLLGLMSLIDRRPSQLSGGQRQRVALGRALVRHASVYLMDEPLSSLDGPLRDHLRREIRRLHERQRMTVLWVTHQAEEAMTLGDRIVVLRPSGTADGTPGGIQQIDTPQAIYESPANCFVAAMIGRPGINIIAGSLTRNGKRLDFHSDSLIVPAIDSIYPKLKNHAGRTIAVGIRPENVAILSETKQDSLPCPFVEGKIEDVERFGCECLISVCGIPATLFETGFDVASNGRVSDSENSQGRFGSSRSFVVRPLGGLSKTPSPGAKVTLAIDPSRLLFFDNESARAIE